MVGEVKASNRALQAPGPLDNAPFAAAIGLGRSLGRFGAQLQQIADTEKERQERLDESRALTEFHQLTNEMARAQVEAQQESEPGARGFVKQQTLRNDVPLQDWLHKQSPAMQEKFGPRVEAFRQQQINEAYAFELEQSEAFAVRGLNTLVTDSTKAIMAGTAPLEDAADLVDEFVQAMPAGAESKAGYRQAAMRNIEMASAQKEAEAAFQNPSANRGTWNGAPKDGSTMVLQGVPNVWVGLSNAVALPESGGRYDVITGGQRFTDFSKHPNVKVPVIDPATGKQRRDSDDDLVWSTAAGRYQITKSTWDWLKSQGVYLPDFSEESQDRAFIELARRRYSFYTGGASLDAALHSGDPEVLAAVQDILSPTWVGLRNKKALPPERFVESIMLAKGTPLNMLEDPRYANLTGPEIHDIVVAAEGEAQKQLRQQEQARTAALDAQEQELLALIRQGNANAIVMRQARSTWLTDPERISRVQKEFEAVNAGLIEAQKFATRLQTFPAGIDMKSAADRDAADVWAEKSGIIAGLQEQNFETVQHLSMMGQDMNGLPPAVVRQLSTMAKSPQTFEFAMDSMAYLMEQSPEAFRRAVDDPTFANTLYYSTEKGNLTQEQMMEAMRIRQSPAYAQVVEQHKAVGKAYLQENPLDINTMVDGVFPQPFIIGGAIDDALPPIEAGQSVAFESEYLNTFNSQMLLYGEPEKALEATNLLMQRNWGASDATGQRRIMRSPPEWYAPKLEGGHEWLTPYLRRTLNLQPEDKVTLVPTSVTRADIKAGRNPHYAVFVEDADGFVRPMTQQDTGTGNSAVLPGHFIFKLPTDAKTLEKERIVRERQLQTFESMMATYGRRDPASQAQLKQEAEMFLQQEADAVELPTKQGERLRQLRAWLKNPGQFSAFPQE